MTIFIYFELQIVPICHILKGFFFRHSIIKVKMLAFKYLKCIVKQNPITFPREETTQFE
jgi:hypothetical protein